MAVHPWWPAAVTAAVSVATVAVLVAVAGPGEEPSVEPAVTAEGPARYRGPDVVLPPSEPLGDLGRPRPPVDPGLPPGASSTITVEHDGLQRGYVLLPAVGLEPGEPAALLVVLHQEVSSGPEVAVDLGLDLLRRHGVTLAYPNGFGGSWNSGLCCGVATEREVDDVGFVAAVLDDVGRHTPVDPDRRALLGYSGGGMLAYRLLCERHPPLLAVVEVNGSLEAPCEQALELPDLLSVHGELDGSVGLEQPVFVNHLGMSPRPVGSTLDTVTGRAGCDARQTRTVHDVTVWTYDGCRGGSRVDVQVVPWAGHGWADVGGAQRAVAWLLPRLVPGARR